MIPEIRVANHTYFFLTFGKSIDELPLGSYESSDSLLDRTRDWKPLLGFLLRQDSGFQTLRRLVAETRVHEPWRLRDHELVATLSHLMSTEWLRVVHRYEPPGGGGVDVQGRESLPAEVPEQPAARPAPPAPKLEDSPTFDSDILQDLQAATLIGAAQEGTPFCEQCAAAMREAGL